MLDCRKEQLKRTMPLLFVVIRLIYSLLTAPYDADHRGTSNGIRHTWVMVFFICRDCICPTLNYAFWCHLYRFILREKVNLHNILLMRMCGVIRGGLCFSKFGVLESNVVFKEI